ncbi:hypothetical protein OOK44_21825 [Streptomyces cellulosae]|uniref:hypothetical protein n=1 Tax=Streptomyces cellulosae TaxID=1968 RepID=UPI0022569EC7|nr:hypothetical protein [Streptomyces cellulosae]WTB88906.1 hypothetical protein OIE99_11945 [Streptomyces cellulosae]WTC56197.1 hypothetical protein OH715_13295 [Streptomyces cellulosae]
MSRYWGHGGPYETWVDCLRRWAAEENPRLDILPRLAQEDFPAETWERFALHLGEALDTRLKAWADRLTEALLAAPDEFSAGRELAQARAGLLTVRAVAGHLGLPESLRSKFRELVDSQIKDLQQQLERRLDDLAAANGSDPRWVEQRRRTLRDNALTATLMPSVPGAADDPWARTHAADRPRRRVITD